MVGVLSMIIGYSNGYDVNQLAELASRVTLKNTENRNWSKELVGDLKSPRGNLEFSNYSQAGFDRLWIQVLYDKEGNKLPKPIERDLKTDLTLSIVSALEEDEAIHD